MKKIYMMCGLPGSGKSFTARKYFAYNFGSKIISLDGLRKEFYGSEEVLGDGKMLFNEAIKRINEELEKGNSVVYDATNVSKKTRKRFLDRFSEDVSIACIWMETPLEECLKNNQSRERHVPEEVIKDMYARFENPTEDEGFIYVWEI